MQQMEPDTVFERLNRFLAGLVQVYLALQVGPLSDTNLFLDNLIPLEKGRIVEKVLIECEDCISGLLLLCAGGLDGLLGGFKLSLPARNIICGIRDFLLDIRGDIGSDNHFLIPCGRGCLGCNSLPGFFLGLLKLIVGVDEKRLVVGDVFPIIVDLRLEGRPNPEKLAALDVSHRANDVDKELFGVPTCPHRRVDSPLVIDLHLEGPIVAFNLLAHFVLTRDIGNWRGLEIPALNFLITKAPRDRFLVGH